MEEEYKQGPEDPARLLELRQQKSRPLINRLQQWACELRVRNCSPDPVVTREAEA